MHKLAFRSMRIHYTVFCTRVPNMEKHKLVFSNAEIPYTVHCACSLISHARTSIFHKLAIPSKETPYTIFCTYVRIIAKDELLFCNVQIPYAVRSTVHTPGSRKCMNGHFKAKTYTTQPSTHAHGLEWYTKLCFLVWTYIK